MAEKTDNIGPYSFEEYLKKAKAFHSSTAPGVVMGGFLVSMARKELPEGILFEAISETPKCLPDAVQILTPCTIGNGWLRIMNTGRFAVSLYDKHSGEGVRAFVDPSKLERRPMIRNWFFNLVPRKSQELSELLQQIKQAGNDIYGLQQISVNLAGLEGEYVGEYRVCPGCGESYPAVDGKKCLACQGKLNYLVI